MADSFTGNINLRKPEVGAANDTWGGVAGLNGDLDILDAIFLHTGLSTVAPPAGHPLEGVPGVGLRIGKGMVLNVEGQVQHKDPTDPTKVGTFSMDQISTGTTVDLKYPPAGGTIATQEVLVAVVQGLHPVGTILSGYWNTPPFGYIFADGRTIGNASSGATNRANDDCLRLFTHLWIVGFPVVGGRGGSAAADWGSSRQLTLPDHSGRTMAGRDNLSGASRGVISGLDFLAYPVGVQSVALTTPELPVHAHNITDASHDHNPYGGGSHYFFGSEGSLMWSVDAAIAPAFNIYGRTATAARSAGITSTHGAGSGTAHYNVQPTISVDVIIAL